MAEQGGVYHFFAPCLTEVPELSVITPPFWQNPRLPSQSIPSITPIENLASWRIGNYFSQRLLDYFREYEFCQKAVWQYLTPASL